MAQSKLVRISAIFERVLNKLFKTKSAQAESPFVLFDIYLNNTKADNHAAYEHLQETPFLVSNQYGEQVKQYNRNVVSFFNLSEIERHLECTNDTESEIYTHTLKYKDKLISWQETPNLASDDFEIFMMNKLVADDIDIRFDVYSTGLSDHYYYALTPEIWKQLEEKYGLELVRRHFQPMGIKFYEPDYYFELRAYEL